MTFSIVSVAAGLVLLVVAAFLVSRTVGLAVLGGTLLLVGLLVDFEDKP